MKKNIVLIVFLSFLSNLGAQNLKSQAEMDWEYFTANKSKLCETLEECEDLDNLSLFEYSKFIDKRYTKRSLMAEAFLDAYPDDVHYNEALDWYLHLYFQPMFISKDISHNQMTFLSRFSMPRYGAEVSPFYRALPIDSKAMEHWVHKGNELVEKILDSDASMERKADLELRLLSRDVNIAKRWYDALPKEPRETDFWESFDIQYWNIFQWRFYTLLDKYPDYLPLVDYINFFLRNVLKERSPILAESYVAQFLVKAGNKNPLSDRSGIKALFQMLNTNLEVNNNHKKQ